MFVVVSYDIRSHVPLTCFHRYLLVFAMFIYLFLASSHQLYAELWLDFLSFAGLLGGRIAPFAVRYTQMGDTHQRTLLSLHRDCILRPLFRLLFTFLYLQLLLYFSLWVVRP